MYLTGNYSLVAICKIVNKKWGFKTFKRHKSGGNPLAPGVLHHMLNNPFYYGQVRSGGHTSVGKHPPIVSKIEFNRIQSILRSQGKKSNMTGASLQFAYTGLLQCEYTLNKQYL